MPWKKGQSGNPAGRKPKGRTLTDILEKTGSKTVVIDGKRVSGKRLLARILWDIATTGKAAFPDGTELIVAPADYLAVIRFIYQHIDGPPKSEMDITSGGEVIKVNGRRAVDLLRERPAVRAVGMREHFARHKHLDRPHPRIVKPSAQPGGPPSDAVILFDGRDTYLFHSPDNPDGFTRVETHLGPSLFKGQHPQVRGNSIIRMGETWTATSVLSASSRRTGERYGLKDMAGIIVHEQFHIFQRMRHPRWRHPRDPSRPR